MQRMRPRRLSPLRVPAGARRRTERGATSVMIALMLVAFMGFGAIAVDVAALWSDRQMLRNSADAGALAIAKDCAANKCGTPLSTAQTLAAANGTGSTSASLAKSVNAASGTVTVNTAASRKHWFAPVLGVNSTTVVASATADWGGISGGTSKLPLAFSWCDFKEQTDGGRPSGTKEYTVKFKGGEDSCKNPSGETVPGGFGWLVPNAETCAVITAIGEQASSSTGNNPPPGCKKSDFEAYEEQTVLVPLYEKAGGTGSNAWYTIYAFAAFRLTGYFFGSSYSYEKPCSGSSRCIRGYFTEVVEVDREYTWSATAPKLGASRVQLTR